MKFFIKTIISEHLLLELLWFWQRTANIWQDAVAPLRKRLHRGGSCYCPCCQSPVRAFKPFGCPPRPQARCPICGSLERHRLTYLYMQQETDLLESRERRMLHVAPEWQMARLFRRLKHLDYLSVDLSGHAMRRMDITNIEFPDNSFDLFYCSHVLEHVPQDTVAMAELYRVLRPGGWGLLLVPIEGYFDLPTLLTTLESTEPCSPEERKRRYGQGDHLRRYGRDFADRLAAVGFSVKVDSYARRLPPDQRARLGLMQEDIFLCAKPRPPVPTPDGV